MTENLKKVNKVQARRRCTSNVSTVTLVSMGENFTMQCETDSLFFPLNDLENIFLKISQKVHNFKKSTEDKSLLFTMAFFIAPTSTINTRGQLTSCEIYQSTNVSVNIIITLSDSRFFH